VKVAQAPTSSDVESRGYNVGTGVGQKHELAINKMFVVVGVEDIPRARMKAWCKVALPLFSEESGFFGKWE